MHSIDRVNELLEDLRATRAFRRDHPTGNTTGPSSNERER
jgi:hypothetical protein